MNVGFEKGNSADIFRTENEIWKALIKTTVQLRSSAHLKLQVFHLFALTVVLRNYRIQLPSCKIRRIRSTAVKVVTTLKKKRIVSNTPSQIPLPVPSFVSVSHFEQTKSLISFCCGSQGHHDTQYFGFANSLW